MCSKNPVAAIHPPTLPSSWWTSKVAFGKFFLVSDMRVKMSQLQLLCHRETWDTSTRGSCSPLQMRAYTRWQQLQQISQPLWSGKSIGGQKTVSQKSNFGNSYCTKLILGPGAYRNLVHNCTIFLCSLDVRNDQCRGPSIKERHHLVG